MHEAIIEALRAGRGLLRSSDHPRLAWAVRAARQRGELVQVLRGLNATPEAAQTFEVRVLALLTLDPDAILLGSSAAVALGWREAQPNEVVVASSQRVQGSRPGFDLTRRRIDPDLVVEVGDALEAASGVGNVGVRCTDRPTTTLDLARTGTPDPIDHALREGVTLGSLHESLELQKGRHGNARVRTHLRNSRHEPWSAAERAGHQALDDNNVSGWVANHPIDRGNGKLAYLDIALPHLRQAFEIDGFEHHGTREAFHSDKERDLDLKRLDWDVVRVSAEWVMADPDRFAAVVAELTAQRAIHLGISPSPPGRSAVASRM